MNKFLMLINGGLKTFYLRRSLVLLLIGFCVFSLIELFGVAFYSRFQDLSWAGKIKAQEVTGGLNRTVHVSNSKSRDSRISENLTHGHAERTPNVTDSLISNATGISNVTMVMVNVSANDRNTLDSNITDQGTGNLTTSLNLTLANHTLLSEMNMTLENDTLCPANPPNLTGPIPVLLDYPSYEILRNLYPDLALGGHWRPKDCLPRHRVAIIIPYRDRDSHLRAFLHNMHRLFQKQQLEYKIYVVEELANQTFNRGKLMNVGFVEAMKEFDWQCFIFHDVDLLPEDDRNLYTCPVGNPRHMSVAVDKFQYQLPYEGIFGGVSALSTSMFRKLNGYSNDYWGWGAEDDDMAKRISKNGYNITRYSAEVARYRMIKHTGHKLNKENPCRFTMLQDQAESRWRTDGLNSLNYDVIAIEKSKIYTKITVNLLEDESRKKLAKEISCPDAGGR